MLHLMAQQVGGAKNIIDSLYALAQAFQVYEKLEGATVSLKVVLGPVNRSFWLPKPDSSGRYGDFKDLGKPRLLRHLKPLSRQQTFARITMFESGSFNIDPKRRNVTFALRAENFMYLTVVRSLRDDTGE